MTRLGPISIVVALAACTPPSEPAPDLLPDAVREAYRPLAPDEPLRLLVVPRSGDRAALDGVDHARRLRHVPVAVADWTLAEAERAAANPAILLVPDGPLVGAGKPASGVTVSADPDLVRRSVGADLVHSGAGAPAATGRGVTIAVVDSGIDADHKDLPRDVLVDWADFVGGDDVDRDEDEHGHGHGHEDQDDAAREDGYGHGTMVAGVLVGARAGIRGIAPDARLVSARVLDEDGHGTVSAAVEATDWILDHADETGVRIIHYSIGSAPAGSFTVDPLALAAESALQAGITVIAAAGNYGTSDGATVHGGIVSPAIHPGVLAVGATDGQGTARRSDDTVAPYSSRGPTAFDGFGKPDLVAPGTAMVLTADDEGTLWEDHPSAHVTSWTGVKLQKSAPYELASGTSFAAPVVTGVAALALEVAPDLSPTGLRAALELTASPLPGADLLASGAGVVNAPGAVRLASAWEHGGEAPAPQDAIEGETVAWGTTLLWDGYVYDTDADLSWLDADGVLAVGDLGGTGILWEGFGSSLRYLGVVVQGPDLLSATSELPWTDDLWGTGILWDGTVQYGSSWVWSRPESWSASFVWPTRLDTAGESLPLFDLPTFSGLTVPDGAAPDPLPVRPDFDDLP